MADGISTIVLAAGLSSRMGDLKPLLPLGDATILEHVIQLFQGAAIEDVRVVVGHRHREIASVVERQKATPVFNPSYRKDMFSSVVAGFASLKPETEAAFILPVDIPLVRPTTIHHLIRVYSRNKGKIIRPTHRGRRGHPPLVPFSLSESIMKWSGSGGLRGALKPFEKEAMQVEVPDKYIHFDVDTPEDYAQLLLEWKTGGIHP